MEDPLTRLATLATLSRKGRGLGYLYSTLAPYGGEGARGTRAGEGVHAALGFATSTSGVVIQVRPQPAFDARQVHSLALLIIEHLVALDLSDREVSGLRV